MKKFTPGHYCQAFRGGKESSSVFAARVLRYLAEPEIAGVKIRVPWRKIEPRQGQYVFSDIEEVW